MTTPFDYSQQLYAYLQAWRQLLEPLSAMSPPMPNLPMPWAMSPMPTPPPAVSSQPAGSGDYIQQLFGYLQTWRQHLEQLAEAGPAQPPGGQPSSSYSAEDGSAQSGRPYQGHAVPVEPEHDGSKASNPEAANPDGKAAYAGEPNSPRIPPDQYVALIPRNQFGNQWPIIHAADLKAVEPITEGKSFEVPSSLYGQAAVKARGQQIILPPVREFTRVDRSSPSAGAVPSVPAPAARQVGPALAARQAGSSAQIKAATGSRFRGLAERARINQSFR